MTASSGRDTAPAATAPVLLETKLHAPVRRRGVVERPRLTAQLTADDLPALTLLSAPAGFGKTTLLASALAEVSTPGTRTAWLALDAGDDDPGIFWAYVLAAVRAEEPDVGEEALAMLRASQPLTSVVASLLNDLAASSTRLLLVLDDYHVIGSVELQEQMAFLLDHLPPQVRLLIAGRADPPLPLARLRARGELRELRAADLRFQAVESAAYLNESMGLALRAEDVETLDRRTEGWVAALQLAALSMQGRDDPEAFIASFAGDDRFVVDYLAEEVLERQPEDVRRFLLETAILDRFTGALCDAVTGGRGGKALLEQLDRANLFLVPLDDRRQWYRYHHLFADVLRARLLDEQPDRLGELHRRASAWYEEAGDPPEAIAHALAGDDVERAARLIELAAPALFQTRQELTARRWLTALPGELFATRPVLSIELVGALMVSGEADGVDELLEGIEVWLDPVADLSEAVVFNEVELARLPAQVAVYRAALALIAGDTAGTIEHATRAIDLAGPDDHLRQGSAAALVGLAQWSLGDLDSAGRSYAASLRALAAAGHHSDVLGCSIALGDIQITQGFLGDAVHTFEAALELAEAHGVQRGTADMHVGLSEVALDRNDLTSARRHLETSAQLGEQAGLPQHAYRSRVAAARLLLAEGDPAAALPLLTEAVQTYDTDMSPPVRPPAAVRARALLTAGQVDEARRCAVASGLAPDDAPRYVREYEHLTLARVLLAEGALEEATSLLERLLAAADDGRRTGSSIETLVLLAVAHQARGDSRAATVALEDALARAEPDGQVRVFVDELPALAPLVRSASTSSGPVGAHARRVLAGTPDAVEPGPSAVGAGAVGEDLSPRELDVLRLLKGELSGPEIARELHVSLNTLRTHTKSIYAKLGVTSRREAVRRAAELGR